MAARVRINQAALNHMLRGRGGPVDEHVRTLTRRTETLGKRNIRVDTGRTRASIHSNVRTRGTLVIGWVGTRSKVGLWLHEGTGVYGPRGRPIRPKNGRFLVFTPKGASGVVFAREVKGVKGDEWLVRALREAVPYPVVEY
ncbi:hypothetical protein SAMN05443665_101729 [Actinomadura meyerae]|jgi:hypothetical protein|uniref:Uncharacterized protein n=1 Tax=Actinomadura meyerae TaxID=240840 RepID=A0A239K682_9ACTN|nr:hypothetical protein [Actinomadura meyerae]SNT13877.1 hypothetical protein SAMN05443665_101729 [Actinomadura meyerae]